jgi:DNA-binding transcriptional ArsR family regulator
MDAEQNTDLAIARIADAIGEPARVRILYSLLDGRARTSTELALVASVSPSTTSVHLHRLKTQRLVKVFIQGKHRYYSLDGTEVAAALEALDVVAHGARAKFVPTTPNGLLVARTCYDHLAGKVGVLLHDRLKALGWLSVNSRRKDTVYALTCAGTTALESLGIDVEATRAVRRRFAYACLDWSERRPHIGGALGAALLKTALKRKWMVPQPDSRALGVTRLGQRDMLSRFGLEIATSLE